MPPSGARSERVSTPRRLLRLRSSALRGRRQRAAAPAALPARDFVPWIPDLMHGMRNVRRACLRDRVEPAANIERFALTNARVPENEAAVDACPRHNGGMRRWLDNATGIICRGFGGALRP